MPPAGDNHNMRGNSSGAPGEVSFTWNDAKCLKENVKELLPGTCHEEV